MSSVVRTTPSLSQRRDDATSRSRMRFGFASRRNRFESSMSSINGWSGMPPTASSSRRETKIPWSPVQIPVRNERWFISQAITPNTGEALDSRTSKLPQGTDPAALRSASNIGGSTLASACRNQINLPRASAAPRCICRARCGWQRAKTTP